MVGATGLKRALMHPGPLKRNFWKVRTYRTGFALNRMWDWRRKNLSLYQLQGREQFKVELNPAGKEIFHRSRRNRR